jgi:hypothetical protein
LGDHPPRLVCGKKPSESCHFTVGHSAELSPLLPSQARLSGLSYSFPHPLLFPEREGPALNPSLHGIVWTPSRHSRFCLPLRSQVAHCPSSLAWAFWPQTYIGSWPNGTCLSQWTDLTVPKLAHSSVTDCSLDLFSIKTSLASSAQSILDSWPLLPQPSLVMIRWMCGSNNLE